MFPEYRPVIVFPLRVVVVLILAMSAWCSNPDESHFRHWWRQEQLQTTEWSEPNFDLARTNFGFGSVVTIQQSSADHYVGVLGCWWHLR